MYESEKSNVCQKELNIYIYKSEKAFLTKQELKIIINESMFRKLASVSEIITISNEVVLKKKDFSLNCCMVFWVLYGKEGGGGTALICSHYNFICDLWSPCQKRGNVASLTRGAPRMHHKALLVKLMGH